MCLVLYHWTHHQAIANSLFRKSAWAGCSEALGRGPLPTTSESLHHWNCKNLRRTRYRPSCQVPARLYNGSFTEPVLCEIKSPTQLKTIVNYQLIAWSPHEA